MMCSNNYVVVNLPRCSCLTLLKCRGCLPIEIRAWTNQSLGGQPLFNQSCVEGPVTNVVTALYCFDASVKVNLAHTYIVFCFMDLLYIYENSQCPFKSINKTKQNELAFLMEINNNRPTRSVGQCLFFSLSPRTLADQIFWLAELERDLGLCINNPNV
jgi:hypothetical protein